MSTLEPARPQGDTHLHIDLALAWVVGWMLVGLLVGLAYVATTTPAAVLSAQAADAFAGAKAIAMRVLP